MAKHGKNYRKVAELVDDSTLYSPLQAAGLAKQTSTTKYDATVEVAIRLGVDPRKADQMVLPVPCGRLTVPRHRLRHR
jgi:large subunit ribosomal protein L1